MTDAAEAFDVGQAFRELGAAESNELSTNAFLRYVNDRFGYTIEAARDLIYSLIELGKIVLTDRYTLRPA